MNSADNGSPPSYQQQTAPPSYGEYESYSNPVPIDEPEPPSIYSPPDPVPEVRDGYIFMTLFLFPMFTGGWVGLGVEVWWPWAEKKHLRATKSGNFQICMYQQTTHRLMYW